MADKPPMLARVKTTELDRLHIAARETQAIGHFLDWCAKEGLILCKAIGWADGSEGTPLLMPHYEAFESLFARYKGIDLDEVGREREALLTALRMEHDEREQHGSA